MEEKSIAIIGGGITGLTAAFYLEKYMEANNVPYKIQLLESRSRLGGKIETVQREGFLIERGPDSFLARKDAAIRLANQLLLDREFIRNETGQAYILQKNALHPMPQGSFMGVPSVLKPFLRSTLLSWPGKIRTSADLFFPRQAVVGDKSLGQFLRYRFGDELVEHIIEPLLSGIYAGDIDEMSLQATFPQFLELESTHGSIIKGIRQSMPNKSHTGKKEGQFLSFPNGMETWIHRLQNSLRKTKIRTNCTLKEIEAKNHTYILRTENKEEVEVDAVLLTTPHHVTSSLLHKYAAYHELDQITSNSVANVALAFATDHLGEDIDGTGFVVSRHNADDMTACTWTHKKWPHTTPEGKALLRVYLGKPTDQQIIYQSDERLQEIALDNLEKTLGIKEEPIFAIVSRWENAMPQYKVGHRKNILSTRRKLQDALPGCFLAGSSYEGVGIPDCIWQGEQAVSSIIAYLQSR